MFTPVSYAVDSPRGSRSGATRSKQQNNARRILMKFNSMFHRSTWRALFPAAVAGVLGLSVLFTTGAAAVSATSRGNSDSAKPTVVLVHGAFADAASWNGVVEQL